MTTATVDTTYETLCEIGRAHSENLDNARWQIGDVGNLVMELYSDRSIEEFAKDINQRKSTVYQYSKVSKFYGVDLRERLKEEMPNLSYSHLREGLRIADTCTPDVIAWLEQVSDHSWTADQASHELTKQLGRQTHESIEGKVSRKFTQEDGFFVVIKFDNDIDVHMGQLVTIKAK